MLVSLPCCIRAYSSDESTLLAGSPRLCALDACCPRPRWLASATPSTRQHPQTCCSCTEEGSKRDGSDARASLWRGSGREEGDGQNNYDVDQETDHCHHIQAKDDGKDDIEAEDYGKGDDDKAKDDD